MKLGIGDIAVYVPRQMMRLTDLVRRRGEEDPKLARHMSRAVQYTGQTAIRFPKPWEDTATMAAQPVGCWTDTPRRRLSPSATLR